MLIESSTTLQMNSKFINLLDLNKWKIDFSINTF